ncbi:MAG: peptide chain release factor N(5)-glutamine methyltransferase [Bacteroidales bacterium]|nr:peptide chain release factor N(5)-glutamine methyltransferase [Bacteroidales bacterium]
MLLGDFLKEGISRLVSLYPVSEARDIVLSLCESRLGIERYTYATEPGYSLNQESFDTLSKDMDRLSAGEPLQYVLGYAWFLGRRFKVTPDVLIPRPETEILCDEAVKFGRDLINARLTQGASAPVWVLDLCTGSGCIAWTLFLEVPGTIVYGVDISEEALSVASGQDLFPKIDASCQGWPDRPSPVFLQADILSDPPIFPGGQFDLVVSNPPYVLESQKGDMRPNVLDHEPALALFVPDDDPLVFYRAVARWARELLSPEGVGIVEINDLLGSRTRDVFLDSGFRAAELINDYSGKNRFVKFSR